MTIDIRFPIKINFYRKSDINYHIKCQMCVSVDCSLLLLIGFTVDKSMFFWLMKT